MTITIVPFCILLSCISLVVRWVNWPIGMLDYSAINLWLLCVCAHPVCTCITDHYFLMFIFQYWIMQTKKRLVLYFLTFECAWRHILLHCSIEVDSCSCLAIAINKPYCFNYTLVIIISFQHNQTPLHYASEHGHSEVVQVLLSHGATVDMKDEVSSIESV